MHTAQNMEAKRSRGCATDLKLGEPEDDDQCKLRRYFLRC